MAEINKQVNSAGKRLPPAAGKGRPKGTQNKITRTIREAIEASFDKVGGAEYLAKMAIEQPAAYMTLLGKVLPAHMNISTKDTTFKLVVERASATDKT
jgi:hypothetical protein